MCCINVVVSGPVVGEVVGAARTQTQSCLSFVLSCICDTCYHQVLGFLFFDSSCFLGSAFNYLHPVLSFRPFCQRVSIFQYNVRIAYLRFTYKIDKQNTR